MGTTIYPQSWPFKTMTVGEVRASLTDLPDDTPVIFESPSTGCYGPGTHYSIGSVAMTIMPRREHVTPAGIWIDDETGEEHSQEEDTQVWEEWRGVVIK